METSEVKQQMFQLSRILRELMQRIVSPICEEYQLTLQQFSVLTELEAEPNQTAGHLSDGIGILKSNFAAVRQKLENRGLIERMRSSQDQRVYTLSLTEKGQKLIEEINQKIDKEVSGYFTVESDESLKKIAYGIDALYGVFSKLL